MLRMRLYNLGVRILEGVMMLFWIILFAAFLNRPLADSFNRILLSFSEARAATNQGIDLDLLTDTVAQSSVDSTSGNVWQSDSSYAVAGRLDSIDPRTNAARRYLRDKSSPMADYAENFVKEADRNGLDWRVVIAISGVESAFGTILPYGSYNAWGWKGDPTRDYSVFASWPAAISYISARIASGYGRNPDPYVIVQSYCPPCARTPGLPWPAAVSKFMGELDGYLAKEVR